MKKIKANLIFFGKNDATYYKFVYLCTGFRA